VSFRETDGVIRPAQRYGSVSFSHGAGERLGVRPLRADSAQLATPPHAGDDTGRLLVERHSGILLGDFPRPGVFSPPR